MEGKYSPALLARTVTVIAAIIVSVLLFLPNYLGVANDGSTDEIMRSAGLYYMEQEPEKIYANYFIRTYTEIPSGYERKKEAFHGPLIFIKLAKALDDFFTRDHMFDIRFLGFVYYLFYLPAFYFLILQICKRVKRFSEGAMIAGAGLILFSDVGYVTYFNSFYPEALWFIAMLFCIGACMSFQNDRSYKWDFFSLTCDFTINKSDSELQTPVCSDWFSACHLFDPSHFCSKKPVLGSQLCLLRFAV